MCKSPFWGEIKMVLIFDIYLIFDLYKEGCLSTEVVFQGAPKKYKKIVNPVLIF